MQRRQAILSPNSRNSAAHMAALGLGSSETQNQNARKTIAEQSSSSGKFSKQNARLIFLSKQLDEATRIDKKRKRVLKQAETLDDSEKDAFTFFFSNKSPKKLIDQIGSDKVAYANDRREKEKAKP